MQRPSSDNHNSSKSTSSKSSSSTAKSSISVAERRQWLENAFGQPPPVEPVKRNWTRHQHRRDDAITKANKDSTTATNINNYKKTANDHHDDDDAAAVTMLEQPTTNDETILLGHDDWSASNNSGLMVTEQVAVSDAAASSSNQPLNEQHNGSSSHLEVDVELSDDNDDDEQGDEESSSSGASDDSRSSSSSNTADTPTDEDIVATSGSEAALDRDAYDISPSSATPPSLEDDETSGFHMYEDYSYAGTCDGPIILPEADESVTGPPPPPLVGKWEPRGHPPEGPVVVASGSTGFLAAYLSSPHNNRASPLQKAAPLELGSLLSPNPREGDVSVESTSYAPSLNGESKKLSLQQIVPVTTTNSLLGSNHLNMSGGDEQPEQSMKEHKATGQMHPVNPSIESSGEVRSTTSSNEVMVRDSNESYDGEGTSELEASGLGSTTSSNDVMVRDINESYDDAGTSGFEASGKGGTMSHKSSSGQEAESGVLMDPVCPSLEPLGDDRSTTSSNDVLVRHSNESHDDEAALRVEASGEGGTMSQNASSSHEAESGDRMDPVCLSLEPSEDDRSTTSSNDVMVRDYNESYDDAGTSGFEASGEGGTISDNSSSGREDCYQSDYVANTPDDSIGNIALQYEQEAARFESFGEEDIDTGNDASASSVDVHDSRSAVFQGQPFTFQETFDSKEGVVSDGDADEASSSSCDSDSTSCEAPDHESLPDGHSSMATDLASYLSSTSPAKRKSDDLSINAVASKHNPVGLGMYLAGSTKVELDGEELTSCAVSTAKSKSENKSPAVGKEAFRETSLLPGSSSAAYEDSGEGTSVGKSFAETDSSFADGDASSAAPIMNGAHANSSLGPSSHLGNAYSSVGKYVEGGASTSVDQSSDDAQSESENELPVYKALEGESDVANGSTVPDGEENSNDDVSVNHLDSSKTMAHPVIPVNQISETGEEIDDWIFVDRSFSDESPPASDSDVQREEESEVGYDIVNVISEGGERDVAKTLSVPTEVDDHEPCEPSVAMNGHPAHSTDKSCALNVHSAHPNVAAVGERDDDGSVDVVLIDAITDDIPLLSPGIVPHFYKPDAPVLSWFAVAVVYAAMSYRMLPRSISTLEEEKFENELNTHVIDSPVTKSTTARAHTSDKPLSYLPDRPKKRHAPPVASWFA